MNRRSFLCVAATASCVTLMPGTLLLEGCTSNPTALLNTVIKSGEAILKVAEAGAPWVPGLVSALNALQSAEAAWKGGSAVSIVISALDTVQAVLGAIPLTAVYSPLVDLLVAAIEAVLTAISTPNTTPSLAPRTAHINPHKGRVALKKPHMMQSEVGAYKGQWNPTAESLGLTLAKI